MGVSEVAYRRKVEFDQPSIEDLEKTQRTMAWLLPLFLIQQGMGLMRAEHDLFGQIFNVIGWSGLTVIMLSMLMGWRPSWISEENQSLLNDDWNREVKANAMRWALIALVVTGSILMAASLWIPLNATLLINLMVGIPLLVAGFRVRWLNRSDSGDDE